MNNNLVLQRNQLHIVSSVSLKNSLLAKDGNVIFENKQDEKDVLEKIYNAFNMNYPRFYKMDALSKAGIICTDLLLQSEKKNQFPINTAIVFSNKDASIEADVNYWNASTQYPSPALFVYTLPNIVIGEICIRYGFKGENAFFITDGFDADWIHWYVNDLFRRTNTTYCISGWLNMLDETADVCLFLITNNASESAEAFTTEQLTYIYNQHHGK